jgi:hypothetical protein
VMGVALLIVVDEAVMVGPGGPVYGGIYRGCSRLGINLSWRAVVMFQFGNLANPRFIKGECSVKTERRAKRKRMQKGGGK